MNTDQKEQTPDVETAPADLPTESDPKGGVLIGLLLPAIQKVRETT